MDTTGEYFVGRRLGFRMGANTKRFSAVHLCLQRSCEQHDLVCEAVHTHRVDNQTITLVDVRSEDTYSRDEANDRGQRLTARLVAELPYQEHLCHPLCKHGLKAWDRYYSSLFT